MPGNIKDSAVQVHDSMLNMLEGLQESGADDQIVQGMAGMIQDFRGFVSESLGGEQGQPQMQQQTTTPEAGAAQVQPPIQ